MLKEKDKKPNVEVFSFYIEAWVELSTCRSFGMGLGPIPFTAIVDYAKIYGISDLEDFIYFIRVMDNAYLAMEANSGREGTKGNNSKSKS